jgi:SlyX protein
MNATDARLTELEVQLALATDHIETLNLAVFRQQEKLDQLQAQLRLVYARLEAVQAAGPGASGHEPPPHY